MVPSLYMQLQKIFSASLPVILTNNYSLNSCNFGVPERGGEFTVFPLHHLSHTSYFIFLCILTLKSYFAERQFQVPVNGNLKLPIEICVSFSLEKFQSYLSSRISKVSLIAMDILNCLWLGRFQANFHNLSLSQI